MQIGQEISIMRIGRRQLNARSAANKNKSTTRIKAKSIPSMTPYIATVWAAFGRAANNAFGKSMEEVNMSVAQALSGLDTGARAAHERKREFRHNVVTPANIRKFEEAASRSGGKIGYSIVPRTEMPY